MIAYTFYEMDNRVRRYAEALAQRGDNVDVVALRQEGQARTEMLKGVRVFRIQHRTVTERSKFVYLAKLGMFLLRSFLFLTWRQLRNAYHLVHVHSVPDFEVFAAMVPKMTGSKLILDIHDLVPEFYASKFGVRSDSLVVKVLIAIERASAMFADHVIVANHIWQKRLEQRSVKPSKCSTILNFPDTEIFQKRGSKRVDGKFIMIYPGTVSHHQGLDIAIRSFARIKDQIPEAEFHIYGTGDQVGVLRELIRTEALEDRVFLKGVLSLDEIASVIENADLGVVPKRKDGFGNEAFSTKILEFMTLQVPVIVPDTMVDRYYFNDTVARFFRANDEEDLANAMLEMIVQPERRRDLAARASVFIQQYTWMQHKCEYLELVDWLAGGDGGLCTVARSVQGPGFRDQ